MKKDLLSPKAQVDNLNQIIGVSKKHLILADWDCDISTVSLTLVVLDLFINAPFAIKFGAGVALGIIYLISSVSFDKNIEMVETALSEAENN